MLLIHMVQQREYDDRTNFITPEWRMNMLEMTALHPINEEILACRAIAVLAEDTLAAARSSLCLGGRFLLGSGR